MLIQRNISKKNLIFLYRGKEHDKKTKLLILYPLILLFTYLSN